MSAKSFFSIGILIIAFAIVTTTGLPAKRPSVNGSLPTHELDTIPFVLSPLPLSYSYDAAGNRIQRIIVAPIFPPIIDTIPLSQTPNVEGGTVKP